jgi:hypothetical protein
VRYGRRRGEAATTAGGRQGQLGSAVAALTSDAAPVLVARPGGLQHRETAAALGVTTYVLADALAQLRDELRANT